MNIRHEWNNIPVSDKLDDTVARSMRKVRQIHRRQVRRRIVTGCTAAAAAMACVVGIGIANPSLAAELPLIGHLFEKLQGDMTYKGDYSEVRTVLTTEDAPRETDAAESETASENAASTEGTYTKTVGDLTVTLSEVYCNDQAVYLTAMLHNNREAFPETAVYEHMSSMKILSSIKLDFTDSAIDGTILIPEGHFIDDRTYVGVIRLDSSNCFFYTDIPESFHMQLSLNTIAGELANPVERPGIGYTEEELLAMSEEEWKEVTAAYQEKYKLNGFVNSYDNYWYDGPFTFDLDLTADSTRTIKREINETCGNAIIEQLCLTPYEVTLEMTDPDIDYIACLFDADGRFMESGPYMTSFPTADYNTASIDLYLVDYAAYMNELKGYRLDSDCDFHSLIEENAVYRTTVSFE